jgi:hypothetical protein
MKTKEDNKNSELIKNIERLLIGLKSENKNEQNKAIFNANYTLSELQNNADCGYTYNCICGEIFETLLKNSVDKFLNGELQKESSGNSKWMCYKVKKMKTKEEIIQFYTKYPGQGVIDCGEWQKEIMRIGSFVHTLSLLVEKNYPDDKIQDYVSFMGDTEERRIYLEYAWECFKNGDFSILNA